MGVEIKLTDKQLPVSPAFIEFLHHHIEGRTAEGSWHDQLSETLIPAEHRKKIEVAQAVSDSVLQHPIGQKAILRAYELLTAILLGQPAALKPIHDRFRFVCVIGCPRHGGSYLTKELYRALGYIPDKVPNVIAHDGFPDAAPFLLAEQHNGFTAMTQQTAEYLAMVEVFFSRAATFDNRVIVPKKATKAAYHGAFFASIWGPDTEYIITLRHPVAACISTYEKSTGLPAHGRFEVRGNIEEWAYRDNLATGADRSRILERDYFDVYLRYWEQYHYNLALGGILSNPRRSVIVYGCDRMMSLARQFFARFGSASIPEDFQQFDKHDRHPQWNRSAEEAIRRIAGMWKSLELEFPVDEVMEGW